MRDRKLIGSRQRSLSSHFILPRRERPLLAGKDEQKVLSQLFETLVHVKVFQNDAT